MRTTALVLLAALQGYLFARPDPVPVPATVALVGARDSGVEARA
jgi:hypothetical protein